MLLLGLASAERDTLRVLFIGNSHTYVNDVPGLVESLAMSGGRVAMTDLSAPGGYTLEQHTVLQQTLDKIAQDSWDYVVLQEQSQIPSINPQRFGRMYPACRLLDSLIRSHSGSTAFYMTWGWENGGTMRYGGDSSPCFRDYFDMQDSVSVAYAMIADELGARLCPVGRAWARARRADSLIDLWQDDHCHATMKGSYLAACVFYAALLEASPVGLSFHAGIPADTARFLQQMAWETVSGVELEPRRMPVPVLRVSPNPARGRVWFAGQTAAGPVNIRDRCGRLVMVVRSSSWDGRSSTGAMAPSGVYYAELGGGLVRFVVLLPAAATDAGRSRFAEEGE